MRFRCRPSWAIAALGLAFAACGAAQPDRFELTTPGSNTGDPVQPLPTLTPEAGATASATPKAEATPKPKPVTKDEKRVIQGWADELRHGRVNAASRYFSVPSLVSNETPGWAFLDTLSDVKEFNRTLPCGAKLISTRRGVDHFVVGIFKLTERPGGGCGTGTGNRAAVAFMIQKHRITHWVRVDPDEPTAAATPEPTPGASPSATATATATETPSATSTPAAPQPGVPGEA